jgi:hypothetical protein
MAAIQDFWRQNRNKKKYTLQSEGPSANVIAADDPRMVARMAGAANGGAR